jgi:hypothetical protein
MIPFITNNETKTYTLKRGDPDFLIQGKFTIAPRAYIEINPKCPTHIANIVAAAIERGYVIPVATITEREKIFMGLTKP